MSDTKERTEQEAAEANAIRQVIAESGSVDFVDVVSAVHKRFRINVTAAQVEQVYHDLAAETKSTPEARTSVTLTSLTSEAGQSEPAESGSMSATPAPVESPQPPQDEMTLALEFVKTVGGLANAKRILSELETALLGQ